MAELTDIQKRFVELDKQKDMVKRFYEELEHVTSLLVQEMGVDSYFQDPEDSVVYKVVVPDGKFVRFNKYDVIRTKREDEAKGSLSKVEAQRAGFSLVTTPIEIESDDFREQQAIQGDRR